MSSLTPEDEALIRLSLIPGIGSRSIHHLFSKFPNPEEVFRIDHQVLVGSFGVPFKLADQIRQAKHDASLENELALMKRLNIRAVTLAGQDYPALLKEVSDPPPVLFYQGSLEALAEFPVAFVGSRKATYYGKNNTERLIGELAGINPKACVVSGLALGIDSVAHRSALERNLPTVALLGGGLNQLYPRENAALAEAISAKGGAVISAFGCNTRPAAKQFPMRNRLISGLSRATLVMEAGFKSGALLTAKFALEQNREVYALPGPADMLNYLGCNKLIQKGEAKLILNMVDIIEDLPFRFDTAKMDFVRQENQKLIDFGNLSQSMDETQSKIAQILKGNRMSPDEISQLTGIPISKLLAVLTEMEIAGMIASEKGGLYTLRSAKLGE